MHKSIKKEIVAGLVAREELVGFCIYCGFKVAVLLPGATCETCSVCHNPGVYSVEELYLLL